MQANWVATPSHGVATPSHGGATPSRGGATQKPPVPPETWILTSNSGCLGKYLSRKKE
jgi:hypothetical protein